MLVLLYFICGLIGGYIAVKLDHPYDKLTNGNLVMIIFMGLFGFITLALILVVLIIMLFVRISTSDWGKKEL